MYLNGVGVPADLARGRVLLQTAAEHGHGKPPMCWPANSRAIRTLRPIRGGQWLDRSAKLGYYRAVEAQRSAGPCSIVNPWAPPSEPADAVGHGFAYAKTMPPNCAGWGR